MMVKRKIRTDTSSWKCGEGYVWNNMAQLELGWAETTPNVKRWGLAEKTPNERQMYGPAGREFVGFEEG